MLNLLTKCRTVSMCFALLLVWSTISSVSFAMPNTHSKMAKEGQWWTIPYPTPFETSRLKSQSFISVKANQFVDEQGKAIIFRGVNIADPDKLVKEDRWTKDLFREIRDWGANMIRLPVHPISYRIRGKDDYFELLDQAVVWANAYSLYLILDWHSIGYLPTELFQHPMYITSKAETYRFWKDASARYKNVPTIAVYEIFNEPTTWGGTFGKPDWTVWKAMNEEIIDIIRAADKTVIPMVAGFNWAYDLSPVAKNPIDREGVAYAIHPYPQKENPQPPSKKSYHKVWQKSWGHLAAKYPMIASELGWVQADGHGAHIPVINDGSYGPHIVEFMEERGISWTVWVFDPEWSPTMIKNWNYEPSEQGAFFKKVMLEKAGK